MKYLLILNGYNNHHLYKFEYNCKENNIVIFYISFYSSYLFQSFDVGCFNILKRSYGKEVKNFIRSYINHIIKLDFFAYFYTIFFITFGEENIRIDFRSISLIPFNLKVMISKLDVKLHMLISIELLLTEVDSWVFKIL